MASPSPLRSALAARLLSILAFISLAAPIARAQEKSLFNGRDLTGWLALGDSWTVKDGAITCNPADETTPLVWKGGVVSNFELNCKFRFDHHFDKKLVLTNPLSQSGDESGAAFHDRAGREMPMGFRVRESDQ